MSDSSIDSKVQEQITARIIGLSSLALFVLCAVAIPAVMLLNPDQPSRLISSTFGAVMTLLCMWLTRVSPRWAAVVFELTMTVAIGFAVVVNGGGHAPASVGLLVLLAMIATVHGARVAIIAAVSLSLAFLVLSMLGDAGYLYTIDPPRQLVYGVLNLFWMALVLTVVLIPIRMLREAMHLSFARGQETELARQGQRDAEASFRTVFDMTTQVMAQLKPDGSLLAVNRVALADLGVDDADAYLGMHFADTPWWPPHLRERCREAVCRSATGETVRFQFEAPTAHGDVVLDFVISPYRDQGGAVRYLLAEGHDITELEEVRSRLAHSQRLDAIGQLAGGVAHDFNNMLGGMLGAADLLRLRFEERGDTELLKHIDLITNAGERAADLTGKLLAFGRRSKAQSKAVSLHSCVESAVAIIRRTIASSTTVTVNLAATRDVIDADRTGIEQVVLNIAVNARDAMPEGGEIHISTTSCELDPAQADGLIGAAQAGPCIALAVTDTGVGIDEATRARLFEPFFTTKGQGQGTGLGLATVFGIVCGHHGGIRVESELGQGTRFTVYFPLLASGTAAPSSSTRRAPSDADLDGVEILVVDDEELLRESTGALLEAIGASVRYAADGQEALRQVADSVPACMVLDVVMPVLSGLEVFERVRAEHPEMPIVLVSGFTSDIRLPPNDARTLFMSKPFSLVQLGAAVASVIRRGSAG
ncbi:MAG: ATP-binding protein [Planctomycetota bacterium]|jgi:PAS domain S-box-containing protein|nr:ATP-binding protein [Planctomycetota bacterium]